jgi:hypothetical protein
MVELIGMVFERTWTGGPGPRLHGLRIIGHPPTPPTLNSVVGQLQRPTSATPAHPHAPHRPTRPSLPAPHTLAPKWGRATTRSLLWTMDYMDFMDGGKMVGRRWSVGSLKIHAIYEIHG